MKRIVLFIIACCLYGFSSAQNITAVEYFIDGDVGAGNGTAVVITPNASINQTFNVSLVSVADGFHTLSVRAKDANNFWSVTHTTPFYKLPASAVSAAPNINKMEYFIDADPGVGAGTDVPVTAGTLISGLAVEIPLSLVADGFHSLTFRTRDANLKWSVSHSTPFYKLPASTVAAAPNINKMEYFIDADPGVGAGTDVPVTAGTLINGLAVGISLVSVADGFHTLTFRTRDANLKWSVAHSTPFYKLPASTVAAAPNINKMEYFIDADPGVGAGTDVPVTAGTSLSDVGVSISLAAVTDGFHILTFRTRDANGKWSVSHASPFYKVPASEVAGAPNLVKLEYFIDTDPGQGAGVAVPLAAVTSITDYLVQVPVSGLSVGVHNISFRALDDLGRWSAVQTSTFIFGSPVPTVTIASTATEPTSVSPIPVTITFSESMTGFDVSDITVTNGAAGSFAGSGASYTANVTPTAQGAVTVSVPANAAVNAATTGNAVSNTLTRTYDLAPTVTITSSATEATNVSPIPVTITFSESVTGFVVGDISVTNGTAGSFAGTGAIYTANITPTGPGVVSVGVLANVAVDVASIGNTISNTLTRTYDAVEPTVVIASSATEPTSVSPIPVTITFSESVTGFVLGDISVTNGTAGSFAGSGATYTASITPTAPGPVTVSVAANVALDAAINGNTVSNTLTRTYQLSVSSQTITFAALTNKTLGDAPFNLTATASSSLAVSFSSTSDKITIAGAQVTMTKAGSVTITANQAGNASFNPAPAVDRTFCINPAKPTIAVSGEDTETVVLTSSSATGNQWFLNGTAIVGATASTLSANATKVGIYSVQVKIDNCESVKSNEFTVVITGTEPRTAGLKFFPNPASEQITISIPGGQGGKIHLSDLRGAQMLSVNSSREEERIDVEHLSTGVYFVTITTAKGTYRVRLVKE